MAWVQLVTVLAGLQLLYFGFLVGRSRVTYGVKLPKMSGHDVFERQFRVHMNSVEMIVGFRLPLCSTGHRDFVVIPPAPCATTLRQLLATWVAWFGGIVLAQNDFAFTVMNVVLHGVPYFALLYRYARSRHAEGGY